MSKCKHGTANVCNNLKTNVVAYSILIELMCKYVATSVSCQLNTTHAVNCHIK